jgi:hypothetical protein
MTFFRVFEGRLHTDVYGQPPQTQPRAVSSTSMDHRIPINFFKSLHSGPDDPCDIVPTDEAVQIYEEKYIKKPLNNERS